VTVASFTWMWRILRFVANLRSLHVLYMYRTCRERQAWCCLQVKLCDPCLSALGVPWCEKALYKYSSFSFLSIQSHIVFICDFCFCSVFFWFTYSFKCSRMFIHTNSKNLARNYYVYQGCYERACVFFTKLL